MSGLDDGLWRALQEVEGEMRVLLRRGLQIQSVSGQERLYTEMIADWARKKGFDVDLWQADEGELSAYPVAGGKHIPLANRPTLVIRWPGRGAGGGRSLIFNGHSDVVAAPHVEKWTDGPWSGNEREGRFYGRGACDVKGAIVSALWAMEAIRLTHPQGLAGDVLLELVPGEEDCVTLGTITSIARGYVADGCVVLEPTEGWPRCASRGGCRYQIQCRGKAVHGTMKWLGEDAIELARQVLVAIGALEKKWNDPKADELFSTAPLTRPITTDLIRGGDWQGMICEECVIAGYLELLPGDELAVWKRRFIRELSEEVVNQEENRRRIDSVADRLNITFPEEYAGHRTNPGSQICATAEKLVAELQDLLKNNALSWQGWSGFNSGCEAGARFGLLGTPTLVWGPGSLAQAHAVDEFVEFSQVRAVAAMFAGFAREWTHQDKE